MKEAKSISIKDHVFVEHASSLECRLAAKKEVPVRYAFWNREILTEPQLREHLRLVGVLSA